MNYLSRTLPATRAPSTCQSCGQVFSKPLLWQEHNDHDQPTMVFLFLCDRCDKERDEFGKPLDTKKTKAWRGKNFKGLVEGHQRLYTNIATNAPVPGTMDICYNCTARTELSCAHHIHDLTIKQEREIMFVDYTSKGGRRTGERVIIYSPATACSHREVRSSNEDGRDNKEQTEQAEK